MKVRNQDIWEAKGALPDLLVEHWPVKTAYWLAKLARKVGEQYTLVDEVRSKLIQQYGTDEGNGRWSIKPDSDHWQQFVGEMNELLQVEVEIPIEPIALPDLDGPSAPKIKPSTLLALEAFVEVP